MGQGRLHVGEKKVQPFGEANSVFSLQAIVTEFPSVVFWRILSLLSCIKTRGLRDWQNPWFSVHPARLSRSLRDRARPSPRKQ